MTRFNKITGIFGIRGTGKTLYMLGSKLSANQSDKALNKTGILDVYRKLNKKVLIIDTLDHTSYRNIPFLKPSQLNSFNSGIYRIIIKGKDIDKLNKMLCQSKNIWNSVLVYEDAKKLTGDKADDYLIELMGDSKQKNIDIFFMYHNFSECPKDVFRKLDFIKCFKTKDSPDTRKDIIGGDYIDVMKVYNSVKNNPNRFYSELIDLSPE